jgi:hypothetical protein
METAFSLAMGVILATTSLLWSQEQTTAPGPVRPGPGTIDIKISLDHDEVSSGSELLLTVTMMNIAQEQHCYKMRHGRVSGIYSFPAKVLKSNGDEVGPLPKIDRSIKETTSSKTECLQAGATLSQKMRLDQLFDLDTPGTYSVQVNRITSKAGDKTFSNSLTFKILP